MKTGLFLLAPVLSALLPASGPAPSPAPQTFTPCIDYSYLQAVMSPCQGPVGGTIRVRMRQNPGSPPALLSFKAVVSHGVPARLHVRLQRRGSDYVLAAPPQLCMQGGGSWETELILADGRNLGVIGGYTPTNCPR